jgi:hypothetical protein
MTKYAYLYCLEKVATLLLLLLNIGPADAAAAFTLITFDVDGTLVAGSGKKADNSVHSHAFSVAVGTVLSTSPKPVVVPPVAQVLPRRDYHGSTDGLILLRLARATKLLPTDGVSPSKLNELFDSRYDYIGTLDDFEIADGISPLPGVMETLSVSATMKDQVACGLVTGNVEGIARRKMKAVGIQGRWHQHRRNNWIQGNGRDPRALAFLEALVATIAVAMLMTRVGIIWTAESKLRSPSIDVRNHTQTRI